MPSHDRTSTRVGVLACVVLLLLILLFSCIATTYVLRGPRLAIVGLCPRDHADLETTAVLVTFTTTMPAEVSVSFRRSDAKEFTRIAAPKGLEHRVELSGLIPGHDYVFFAEADRGREHTRSEERHLTIRRFQALVFTEHTQELSIARDYDQRATVRVKNVDHRRHAARLRFEDAPDDLVVGVLGPGSEDEEPPVLEPGEVREFRILLFAPAARRSDYSLNLSLVDLEHPGPDSAFDTHNLRVKIKPVPFKLSVVVDQKRRDPATIAVPVVFKNEGGDLCDFGVDAPGPLENAVYLTPDCADHILRAGDSVELLATPVLYPGWTKLAGDLVAHGAGQELRVPIDFSAPAGSEVFLAWGAPGLRVEEMLSGGCTNKGTHVVTMRSGGGGLPPPQPPGDGLFGLSDPSSDDPLDDDEKGKDKSKNKDGDKEDDAFYQVPLERIALGLTGLHGTLDSRPWVSDVPLVPGQFADPCVLAGDNDTGFVWHMNNDGKDRILAASLGPDRRFRVRPVVIGPPSLGGTSPAAARLPDGSLAVAFVASGGRIALSTSKTGESWAEPKLFESHNATNPAMTVAPDGRPAIAWIEDGKLRLSLGESLSTVATDARPGAAALAFDSTGALHIAYGRQGGSLVLLRSPDGKSLASSGAIEAGSTPTLCAGPGALWLACEGTPGTIVSRQWKDGAWGAAETVVHRELAARPSVLFRGPQPVIAFHAGSKNDRVVVDTVFLAARGEKGYGEPRRTACLEPSVERAFFTIAFDLKNDRNFTWASPTRSVTSRFPPFDTNLFVNGRRIHSIVAAIPEGRFLYPVDPRALHYSAQRATSNELKLKVDRLNRAHYLMAYKLGLVIDSSYSERYVFAATQREADLALERPDPTCNRDRSNIGVYANFVHVPPALEPGANVTLRTLLFNIGPKAAEGVVVQVFDGPPKLEASGSYSGKALTQPLAVGSVPPQDGRVASLVFPFRADLRTAFTAVWSRDPDFDLSNNVQGVTFTVADSPLATIAQADLAPRGSVQLDVKAGGVPLALDQVKVTFFPAGNHLQPVEPVLAEGRFALRAFTYDILVRDERALAPVEAWIQGLQVLEGKTATASVDLVESVAVFDGSPEGGFPVMVELFHSGLRGGALRTTVDARPESRSARVPAGKYDVRLSPANGPGAERTIEGVELTAGKRVSIPVTLDAGRLTVSAARAPATSAFTYFVSLFDRATPPHRLLDNVPHPGALELTPGHYDVLVTHPFAQGDPLTHEEWHRDVTVASGAEAHVEIGLPLVTFRARTRWPGGQNVVHVHATLTPAGERTRALYQMDCDKECTVLAGKYDIAAHLPQGDVWAYDQDLGSTSEVTLTVPGGSIDLDVTSGDSKHVEPDLDFTLVPRLCDATPGASDIVTSLEVTDLRRFAVRAGRYDLRIGALGYGPDAVQWLRDVVVEPQAVVATAARFKLGTLFLASASGKLPARLRRSVALYPAHDRVKRLVPPAAFARLDAPVAVMPGRYDVFVQFPELGPGHDQWLENVRVRAGETTHLRLKPTGAIALHLVQAGSGEPLDRAGAVFDRVGEVTELSARLRTLDVRSEPVPVLPGFYDVTPSVSGVRVAAAKLSNVAVGAGELVEQTVEVPVGEVVVQTHLADGTAPPAAHVRLVASNAGLAGAATLERVLGVHRGIVPAGDYRVQVQIGSENWFSQTRVAPGERATVDVTVDPATLAFFAKRADGELLAPTVEVFVPGVEGLPLTKMNATTARTLRAGTYDVRLTLATGEVRWRRGVELKSGEVRSETETFPARNLTVTIKRGDLARRGLPFKVGLFRRGSSEPAGWFDLGSGAALEPGDYDILLACAETARDGIWQRNVKVTKEPTRLELNVAPGSIRAETYPVLHDVDGRSAVTVRAFRAGSADVIATGRAGEDLLVPEGDYDIAYSHDGLYGKIDERQKGVTVHAGVASGRMLPLGERFGEVHFAGRANVDRAREVVVLRGGKPVARATDEESLALPPGAYDLTAELKSDLEKGKLAAPLGGTDIFAGLARWVDFSNSRGTLLFQSGPGPRRVRVALHGQHDRVLLEAWSSRELTLPQETYDVSIDNGAWIQRVTIVGGEPTVVAKEGS